MSAPDDRAKAEKAASDLREALRFARNAIFGSSPDDAFGLHYTGRLDALGKEIVGPVREEILAKIDEALLSAGEHDQEGR